MEFVAYLARRRRRLTESMLQSFWQERRMDSFSPLLTPLPIITSTAALVIYWQGEMSHVPLAVRQSS